MSHQPKTPVLCLGQRRLLLSERNPCVNVAVWQGQESIILFCSCLYHNRMIVWSLPARDQVHRGAPVSDQSTHHTTRGFLRMSHRLCVLLPNFQSLANRSRHGTNMLCLPLSHLVVTVWEGVHAKAAGLAAKARRTDTPSPLMTDACWSVKKHP